ncbi:protein Dr1-like [Styela clava]
MADDDELNLPRAAVNKLIKETLPQVRVSNESRELIVQCCNEFIHLLSSEANEMCNKNAKKTIMPEHVLQALNTLGFGSYTQECKEVLEECKHVALKKRRGSSRLENLGIPEEELLRQQQELFAKARQEQLEQEQQEWLQMQQHMQLQQQQSGGGQPMMVPGSGMMDPSQMEAHNSASTSE